MTDELRELQEKLSHVKRVINIDELQTLVIDKNYIHDYYRINRIPYSLFLPSASYIYLAISRDGIFKSEDLLESAKVVEKHIHVLKAINVLELATGRGANSSYLAERFKEINFFGIDISRSQLRYAFRRARTHHNYQPEYGDYHNLQRYADNSFDIVFIVEALCYSTDKLTVLNEAKRVLRRGGAFIIFDGYLNKNPIMLNELENDARVCVERGMGLQEFEWYESFKEKIAHSGLALIFEEDVTEYTIPMLQRLERMAISFFHHTIIAKLLSAIFPRVFILNAVSGYLGVTTVNIGLFSYKITVLRKV